MKELIMAKKPYPKQQIVEGEQDKRVIPYLMEANGIEWPKKNPPVYIDVHGSDNILKNNYISIKLKQDELEALGIIVDADEDFNSRWDSVRNACLRTEMINDIPEEMPETGLICSTRIGVKFGVWIMPDNQNRGMLETFLAYLVPDESESLWQYVQNTTHEAKNQGATFIDAHSDKAYIYTWLAWQNPPGRQLHNAVMETILNPTHPKAQTFVTWFRQLYDL